MGSDPSPNKPKPESASSMTAAPASKAAAIVAALCLVHAAQPAHAWRRQPTNAVVTQLRGGASSSSQQHNAKKQGKRKSKRVTVTDEELDEYIDFLLASAEAAEEEYDSEMDDFLSDRNHPLRPKMEAEAIMSDHEDFVMTDAEADLETITSEVDSIAQPHLAQAVASGMEDSISQVLIQPSDLESSSALTETEDQQDELLATSGTSPVAASATPGTPDDIADEELPQIAAAVTIQETVQDLEEEEPPVNAVPQESSTSPVDQVLEAVAASVSSANVPITALQSHQQEDQPALEQADEQQQVLDVDVVTADQMLGQEPVEDEMVAPGAPQDEVADEPAVSTLTAADLEIQPHETAELDAMIDELVASVDDDDEDVTAEMIAQTATAPVLQDVEEMEEDMEEEGFPLEAATVATTAHQMPQEEIESVASTDDEVELEIEQATVFDEAEATIADDEPARVTASIQDDIETVPAIEVDIDVGEVSDLSSDSTIDLDAEGSSAAAAVVELSTAADAFPTPIELMQESPEAADADQQEEQEEEEDGEDDELLAAAVGITPSVSIAADVSAETDLEDDIPLEASADAYVDAEASITIDAGMYEESTDGDVNVHVNNNGYNELNAAVDAAGVGVDDGVSSDDFHLGPSAVEDIASPISETVIAAAAAAAAPDGTAVVDTSGAMRLDDKDASVVRISQSLWGVDLEYATTSKAASAERERLRLLQRQRLQADEECSTATEAAMEASIAMMQRLRQQHEDALGQEDEIDGLTPMVEDEAGQITNDAPQLISLDEVRDLKLYSPQTAIDTATLTAMRASQQLLDALEQKSQQSQDPISTEQAKEFDRDIFMDPTPKLIRVDPDKVEGLYSPTGRRAQSTSAAVEVSQRMMEEYGKRFEEQDARADGIPSDTTTNNAMDITDPNPKLIPLDSVEHTSYYQPSTSRSKATLEAMRASIDLLEARGLDKTNEASTSYEALRQALASTPEPQPPQEDAAATEDKVAKGVFVTVYDPVLGIQYQTKVRGGSDVATPASQALSSPPASPPPSSISDEPHKFWGFRKRPVNDAPPNHEEVIPNLDESVLEEDSSPPMLDSASELQSVNAVVDTTQNNDFDGSNANSNVNEMGGDADENQDVDEPQVVDEDTVFYDAVETEGVKLREDDAVEFAPVEAIEEQEEEEEVFEDAVDQDISHEDIQSAQEFEVAEDQLFEDALEDVSEEEFYDAIDSEEEEDGGDGEVVESTPEVGDVADTGHISTIVAIDEYDDAYNAESEEDNAVGSETSSGIAEAVQGAPVASFEEDEEVYDNEDEYDGMEETNEADIDEVDEDFGDATAVIKDLDDESDMPPSSELASNAGKAKLNEMLHQPYQPNVLYRILLARNQEQWVMTMVVCHEWTKAYLSPIVAVPGQLWDLLRRASKNTSVTVSVGLTARGGGQMAISSGEEDGDEDEVEETAGENEGDDEVEAMGADAAEEGEEEDDSAPPDSKESLPPNSNGNAARSTIPQARPRSSSQLSAPARRVRPNALYRFLLGQGQVGHVVLMQCVLGVSWFNTYLPTLSAIAGWTKHTVTGGRPPVYEDDIVEDSSQTTGFVSTDGNAVRGGKQKKSEIRKADQSALEQLRQIGDVAQFKYHYVSDSFMKRHQIGRFRPASTSASMVDSRSSGSTSKKQKRVPDGLMNELINSNSADPVGQDESDDEWVVETLSTPTYRDGSDDYHDRPTASSFATPDVDTSVSLSMGSDGPGVTVGIDFSFGESKKKRQKRRKKRKLTGTGPRRSDRESGMIGRIRATGANSVVGRSLLGAYPGDALPPNEAADARGLFDLATKYGYGDWFDEDDFDADEEIDDDYEDDEEGDDDDVDDTDDGMGNFDGDEWDDDVPTLGSLFDSDEDEFHDTMRQSSRQRRRKSRKRKAGARRRKRRPRKSSSSSSSTSTGTTTSININSKTTHVHRHSSRSRSNGTKKTGGSTLARDAARSVLSTISKKRTPSPKTPPRTAPFVSGLSTAKTSAVTSAASSSSSSSSSTMARGAASSILDRSRNGGGKGKLPTKSMTSPAASRQDEGKD